MREDASTAAADVFRKLDLELRPDPSRTVIRPFGFGRPEAFGAGRRPRPRVVADRIRALAPATRARMWDLVSTPIAERHRNVRAVFLRRHDEVADDIGEPARDETERLLIGAYFSQEYAF